MHFHAFASPLHLSSVCADAFAIVYLGIVDTYLNTANDESSKHA